MVTCPFKLKLRLKLNIEIELIPTINFAPKQKIMKILFWIGLVIIVQFLNQVRKAEYSNLNPCYLQDKILS